MRLSGPVFAVTLGACALAGPDARRNSPDANAPMHDAPSSIHSPDAPPASGCAQAFTGVLATWSLTGAAGNQASSAASSTATGVTAGALTRSAGPAPAPGNAPIKS